MMMDVFVYEGCIWRDQGGWDRVTAETGRKMYNFVRYG